MNNLNDKLYKYYKEYWQRRISSSPAVNKAIRDNIPQCLRKYTSYGAVANLVSLSSRVLDIGCGDGTVSSLYISKGCDVHGLDISQQPIDLAMAKGIKGQIWDLNQVPLPFDDNSFKNITVVDVLEHLVDPLSILKECHRLLNENGRLILSIPNFARWFNRLRMLYGCPKDILHWGGYGDGIEHIHWFTKPRIRHLLRLAGFREVRFYPIGLPFGFIFGLIKFYGLANWLLVKGMK